MTHAFQPSELSELPDWVVADLGPNFQQLAPAMQRAHVHARLGIALTADWRKAVEEIPAGTAGHAKVRELLVAAHAAPKLAAPKRSRS